jgi:hypothetical protein
MAVQIAAGVAIRVAARIAFDDVAGGVAARVSMIGVVCQATLPREVHSA